MAAVRSSKEICTVEIGEPVLITVRIQGDEYIFTVNEKTAILQAVVKTTSVAGYWQYPYFGSDEAAPHEIHIYMQELEE